MSRCCAGADSVRSDPRSRWCSWRSSWHGRSSLEEEPTPTPPMMVVLRRNHELPSRDSVLLCVCSNRSSMYVPAPEYIARWLQWRDAPSRAWYGGARVVVKSILSSATPVVSLSNATWACSVILLGWRVFVGLGLGLTDSTDGLRLPPVIDQAGCGQLLVHDEAAGQGEQPPEVELLTKDHHHALVPVSHRDHTHAHSVAASASAVGNAATRTVGTGDGDGERDLRWGGGAVVGVVVGVAAGFRPKRTAIEATWVAETAGNCW
jgi:hypothetical protein